MIGKIIKGIGGFYYVDTGTSVYECRAVGIFRKENKKPMVGDDVVIEVLSEEEKTGSLVEICPRKNELIRPAVANIDQMLMIFAAAKPDPNLNLLDRFLVMMEVQEIPVYLCFNKADVASTGQKELLKDIYEKTGYSVLFFSAKEENGIEPLREILKGKTSVLAGPSGVGKSTLMNLLYPKAEMETGQISEKIQRGKHTTRHSELFLLGEKTYLCDTPGFSSLYLTDMKNDELRNYFPEFLEYEPECRFQGCLHLNEPDCGVKEALEAGRISESRYENYKKLLEEIKKTNEKKFRS